MLKISQTHLNLLQNCPRKFQHLYLDQLGFVVSPAEQKKMNWGKQFHLLMQQYQLGLPVDLLAPADPQMLECFHRFLARLPDDLRAPAPSDPNLFRAPEHERTLRLAPEYLLIVIYDLLIANSEQAQIIDWKTYRQPRSSHELAENWQTRLYLYLGVETTDYLPEQVSMTYWFVQPQGQDVPTSLTFNYNSSQHRKNQQDLQELLTQLTQWRQTYQNQGHPFNQCQLSTGHCQSCQFAIRCHRHPDPENSPALNPPIFNVSQIAEVPEIAL